MHTALDTSTFQHENLILVYSAWPHHLHFYHTALIAHSCVEMEWGIERVDPFYHMNDINVCLGR